MKHTIICPCGTRIEIADWQAKRKRYCSKKCMYKYRTRPKGLEYKVVSINRGWFGKGKKPWNLGTVGKVKPNSGSIKPGQRLSTKTEFRKGHGLASDNYNWKGDSVGYHALHSWVKRRLGRAGKCKLCGSVKIVQWANKSHEYKRALNDWVALCSVCHRALDGITKLTKMQSTTIRRKNAGGETQKSLAKKYGVHQSTISNIMTNKTQFYV